MPDGLLSAENLSCGYPGRTVLADVSFELLPGTVTGILGPNGAGKSTLLKTLGGTIKPLAGTVRVLGQDLHQIGTKERASLIAYVPQEELTEFGFSAIEMVAMGRIARSNGLFETKEDLSVAEGTLLQTDALHLRDRLYRELSGGEKQRVLIARALAQETRVMLLDEPSSHLDLSHQAHLVAMIRKFAQRGDAVLVALHDLNIASATVDTAIVVSDGKVAMSGPVGEILASPLLDEVYGTKLQRIEGPQGQTLVLPTYG